MRTEGTDLDLLKNLYFNLRAKKKVLKGFKQRWSKRKWGRGYLCELRAIRVTWVLVSLITPTIETQSREDPLSASLGNP